MSRREPDPRSGVRGIRLWVVAVALAAVIGAAAGAVLAINRPAGSTSTPELQAQVTWPAGARTAPDFALRDQAGRLFSLAHARGRPVLLTFLDSRCKRECPVEGRTLAQIQRRLSGTGAVLAVVSVDPWADTAASARAFAAHSGWHGDWHWLLAGRKTLAPVWRAYNIAVKRAPGDVLHAAALYVIDPHGDLRAGYLFPFAPDVVSHDVRWLAGST
jgi:cytochrome oxidase Cu insertion factor (SCO1/SenC/PrrC family)